MSSSEKPSSFGTIKLNDGHDIPAIAFGTGTSLRDKDVVDYVEQAIETGFSHIDTAQMYNNEEGVGQAIAESGLARENIFVTTKYMKGAISKALKASLAKLKLDYVDLYLIHWPQFVKPHLESAWREFEAIKDRGLAKSIGVSNFGLDDLKALLKVARITPAVNQIPLHPYNYTQNKPLLDYAATHGIVIEAYSPLTPITTYPGGPVDVPVYSAAKRRGVSPTQILLAWVKVKGAVIVTTSRNKQHLQEYLSVSDIEPLTAEEVRAIDEAGSQGPPALRRRPRFRRLAVLVLLAMATGCYYAAGYKSRL